MIEEEVDYVNRGDILINKHIQVRFDDVIAEPDGTHSLPCVWRNAFKCFRVGKNSCYRFLTTICSIPLACCIGCNFALVTFAQIWFVTPCFRFYSINIQCCSRYFSAIVHCILDPFCESCGLLFSRIKVDTRNNVRPHSSDTPVLHQVISKSVEPVEEQRFGNVYEQM